MLTFRIRALLARREEDLGRRVTLSEVARETGISPQVLSSLSHPGRPAVTTSANLEAICRFFRCGIEELVVFAPPVTEGEDTHVDALYPTRRRAARDEAPPAE